MAVYLKKSETNICAKLEPISDDLYQITWFDMWDNTTDEPLLILNEKTTIRKPWLITAEILSADHPLTKAMDKCETEYYNDYVKGIMLEA